MDLAQRVPAKVGVETVPPECSAAASACLRARDAERAQLAEMGRHDLAAEWSPDARRAVLAARQCIEAARVARARFRSEVEAWARAQRKRGAPARVALRDTQTFIRSLDSQDRPDPERLSLEIDVLRWVAEVYQAG
jgi:hypothetical protein